MLVHLLFHAFLALHYHIFILLRDKIMQNWIYMYLITSDLIAVTIVYQWQHLNIEYVKEMKVRAVFHL